MTKKENEYLIDIEQPQLRLQNVSYNHIDFSNDLMEEMENDSLKISSKTEDYCEIDDYTNTYVKIKFVRKKFFDPKMFFEVEVTINALYDINEDIKKEITLLNLESELKNRRDKLLTPVVHQASLLIANITNVNSNDIPMITPPFLKEETE